MRIVKIVLGIVVCMASITQAADRAQIDDLNKEINDLRGALNSRPVAPLQVSNVDQALDGHGCDTQQLAVKTRTGKLTLGALVQVWYYGFQQDRRDAGPTYRRSHLPGKSMVPDY